MMESGTAKADMSGVVEEHGDQNLRFALAVAIVRSKKEVEANANAMAWKRKAEELEDEVQKLRNFLIAFDVDQRVHDGNAGGKKGFVPRGTSVLDKLPDLDAPDERSNIIEASKADAGGMASTDPPLADSFANWQKRRSLASGRQKKNHEDERSPQDVGGCESSTSEALETRRVERFLRNVGFLLRVQDLKRGKIAFVNNRSELLSDGKRRLLMVVEFITDLLVKLAPDPEDEHGQEYIQQAADFVRGSVREAEETGNFGERSRVYAIIDDLVFKLLQGIMTPASAKSDEDAISWLRRQRNICSQREEILLKISRVASVGQRVLLSATNQIAEKAKALLRCHGVSFPLSGSAFAPPAFAAQSTEGEGHPLLRCQSFESLHHLLEIVETILDNYSMKWFEEGSIDKAMLEKWVAQQLELQGFVQCCVDRGSLVRMYVTRISAKVVRQLQIVAKAGEGEAAAIPSAYGSVADKAASHLTRSALSILPQQQRF